MIFAISRGLSGDVVTTKIQCQGYTWDATQYKIKSTESHTCQACTVHLEPLPFLRVLLYE